MCGGSGTRLWPWSRSSMPKQCLPLIGDTCLLEQAMGRIKGLSPNKKVLIVTTAPMADAISNALGDKSGDCDYLLEPMARNTAMCIGLSAARCFKDDPDSLLMINTADHDIDQESFLEHARAASKFASENDRIVTFGIKPRYAATVFGYIEPGVKCEGVDGYDFYELLSFHEKPNKEKAQKYLDSGRFSWNSGMFLARSKILLDEYKLYMPTLYERLKRIMDSDFDEQVIQKEYESMSDAEMVQFDVGIAEKSQRFTVLISNFAWQDIGDWFTLSDLWTKDSEGNVIKGDVLQVDSKGCLLFGDKHTAVIGMEDIVVVNMGDAVLVCPKNRAPEVGNLVKILKKEGREGLI